MSNQNKHQINNHPAALQNLNYVTANLSLMIDLLVGRNVDLDNELVEMCHNMLAALRNVREEIDKPHSKLTYFNQ